MLQLHLKRFEYDWARDTLVKVNDRHEFPEELDEIETNDLWSLKARLQDIDDPELDGLWDTVCAMTASHS